MTLAPSLALVWCVATSRAPTKPVVHRGLGCRRAHVRARAEPLTIATIDAEDVEAQWPYDADDFRRMDESADGLFYQTSRFVTHIDDGAIAALTEYYRREVPEGADVLDVCSSWISHLPREKTYGRVVGVGLNLNELEANKQLTEVLGQDLNDNPSLPFDDSSFDAVVCCVSVDYLIRPLEIFAELHRVLRPGGSAHISFSNRCFPTKAVRMWLDADDVGRLGIVSRYFVFAADFEDICALDISPLKKDGLSSLLKDKNPVQQFMSSFAAFDPMFVVSARKPVSSE